MTYNVLSVFDGISCGRVALDRAGIRYDNYFASEIDKYAIQVAQRNYPDTIQLGDILNWKSWNLPKIDLLIGGSPCQGFSNAGQGLNFDDPRSRLFFVYRDILFHLIDKNPKMKFLLENVKMKKEWQDIITDQLGVEPVLIDSALVSAQSRKRLYWMNWEVEQPKDRHIYLMDILEYGEVDRLKSYAVDANYYKGGNPRSYFKDGRRQLVFEHQSHRRFMVRGAAIRNQVTSRGVEQQLNIRKDEKSNCVVPSYPNRLNGVVSLKTIGHGYVKESEKDSKKYPTLCAQSPHSKHLIRVGTDPTVGGHDINRRIYSDQGKSPTLSTMQGGHRQPKVAVDESSYRKLTPLECERLQTLPDHYTAGISNTQRYKTIGSGWTVEVVAHIFRSMNDKRNRR